MQKYYNSVQNRHGAAVAGASITVATILGVAVILYSDNGVTVRAAPLTTDANGYFELYAADGRYDITISGPTITTIILRDILLEDPADGASSGTAFLTLASGGGFVGFSHAQTYLAGTLGAKGKQSVSVKDAPYNAVGDGVANDTAAILAALNSGASSVFLPKGTYKTTATIYIPENVAFTGDGAGSVIAPSSVSGPAISNYLGAWGTYKSNQRFESITVTGTCTYGVIWLGGINSAIRNVLLKITATHGFIVDGSFGSKFDQLSTAGSTISGACFWAGSDFNANHLDGLYTSNYCAYNFLSDVGANAITGYVHSLPTGQGSTLTNICCQGGAVGMALNSVDYGGWTINSPYFENCVTPMRLGTATSICRSVTINSPLILAPAIVGHPGGTSVVALDIDNALNVTINSPEFGSWGATTDLIQYRLSHKVLVNGFYLSTGGIGSTITNRIKHKAGADTDGGVMVIGEETGASGRNHFLLMKSETLGYQHYKMNLSAVGAWVAASIVPPAA